MKLYKVVFLYNQNKGLIYYSYGTQHTLLDFSKWYIFHRNIDLQLIKIKGIERGATLAQTNTEE